VRNDLITYENLEKRAKSFVSEAESNKMYNQVMIKWLKNTKKLMHLLSVFHFICMFLPVVLSLIMSLIKHDLKFFNIMLLPFIDPGTQLGFIINHMTLLILSFSLYGNFMTVELANFVHAMVLKLKADLIILKIREFGDKVRLNKIERNLIKIIEELQNQNEYTAELRYTLELSTFVQISISSIGICLSIFLMMTFSAPIGLVVTFDYFAQVIVLCSYGAIITHQKEKIVEELCGLPWYELSNKNQKIFLQFIHMCQSSNELELPLIGVLDMRILTDVVNGSYSYFMFLYNFLK
jgi:hypothetical protein